MARKLCTLLSCTLRLGRYPMLKPTYRLLIWVGVIAYVSCTISDYGGLQDSPHILSFGWIDEWTPNPSIHSGLTQGLANDNQTCPEHCHVCFGRLRPMAYPYTIGDVSPTAYFFTEQNPVPQTIPDLQRIETYVSVLCTLGV